MERAGLTESLNAQKAAAAWIDVVGPAINRYTTRRYVSDGVLHVYLTSAPLKNELSFNRDRLISAINRVVGAEVISDVQFH
jgi:predicted nucleic acid-binding Zn ribbon protein